MYDTKKHYRDREYGWRKRKRKRINLMTNNKDKITTLIDTTEHDTKQTQYKKRHNKPLL